MPDAAGNPLPAFTDLLLHDLGGETAGTIPEAEFSVAEWRTAPLIDLAAMNGMRRYLHDGKAADVNAAILLHSGEASAARAAYRKLGDGARRSLIAYLEGL